MKRYKDKSVDRPIRRDSANGTGRMQMGNGKRLLVILTLAISAMGGAAGTATAETVTVFNTKTHTIPEWRFDQPHPAPSSIGVQYVEGPITDVDLYLNALDANDMGALHLLLVSPSGESEVVMSLNCGAKADNRYLTFDQSAAGVMPTEHQGECPLDTYKPSDGSPSHPFPFEGLPGGPTYTHNFDNFDNENANGWWRLYAFSGYALDGCSPSCAAQLEGGWALRIETGPIALDLPGGAATHGPADPYPQTQIRADDGKLITDLNVYVNGVFHNEPDDIDMVLEKVNGPRVMLMSDACGEYDVNAYGWLFDDEAPAPMPDNGTTNICGATAHRPTNHQGATESLPAPAPPGPYASSLSAFDLTEAGGEYRLWVNDDENGREGFFTHNFQLDMQTRTPPETTIDKAPPARTTKRRATFEFSSSEAGSSFECRLDARPFKSCTSPKTYRRLDRGEHRFRVRATNAGITDPTPARARWRVTG